MSRRLSSRSPDGEGASGQSSSSMAVLSLDAGEVANDPSHPTRRPTAAVSGFSSGKCACKAHLQTSGWATDHCRTTTTTVQKRTWRCSQDIASLILCQTPARTVYDMAVFNALTVLSCVCAR